MRTYIARFRTTMCWRFTGASVLSAVSDPFIVLDPRRFSSIVQPRDIDPKLGPKNRLNNAEKLFEGRLVGPESYATYDGQIYTAVYDGYLLRIDEDDLVPIAKFGKKCGESYGIDKNR